MRNRRKRKGSDDDGDSPVQDIDTPEVAKQLIFFFPSCCVKLLNDTEFAPAPLTLLQLALHVGRGRFLISIVLNITEFNWILWHVF